MRRIVGRISFVALFSAAAFAQSGNSQSLGDIARANREKQQTEQASGVTPRVITNQDIPASTSSGIPAENPDDPMTTVSGAHRNFRAYQNGSYQNSSRQRWAQNSEPYGARPFDAPGYSQRGGDQLQGQIRQQENRIAELQARIDRASASMHPNGNTAQFEGPLNRYQAVQTQRIDMMQQMLQQQRERLAMMQDEARRQGMHTTVYDP